MGLRGVLAVVFMRGYGGVGLGGLGRFVWATEGRKGVGGRCRMGWLRRRNGLMGWCCIAGLYAEEWKCCGVLTYERPRF